MKMEKIQAWYQASRPPFFVATLIPLSLGGVVAGLEGKWDPERWLIVLLASFLVHLNTNLANDYFDHFAGVDAGTSIGGSRVLQEGKITPGQLRNSLILLYGLAFFLGLLILWLSRVWWLAPLMLFSFLSSLFYTAPPIRYGYHGLGELLVGINMGPLMVVGTTAALTGHFSSQAFWLSLPVGILVASILYYQSLPDMNEDRSTGKFTLAVRLGKKRAVWGFRIFVGFAIASVIFLVTQRLLHPIALGSLLTVFLAYRIDRTIRATADWKDLHGRGGRLRIFYLINGLILILTTGFFK